MYKDFLKNRITRHRGEYTCYLCNHKMKFYAVEDHMRSFMHLQKLNQIDDEKQKAEIETLVELFSKNERKTIVTNQITFVKISLLNCHLCKCQINGLPDTYQHIKDSSHQQCLKIFAEEYKQAIAKDQPSQNYAKKTLLETHNFNIKNSNNFKVKKSEKLTLPHENMLQLQKITNSAVTKSQMQGKIENFSKSIISIGSSSKSDFGNSQSHSVSKPGMVDDLLNNLVSLDFKESQIRRLPRFAKKKPSSNTEIITENKKPSFAKNVVLHGKDYIKFCIDPGQENIYNLNNEEIKLLQLGISLIIPHHSDRFCIPCGNNIPNDIQVLFEHLQSQEHLKNMSNLQGNDKVLSDLELAKLYMHSVGDNLIQCHACNLKIKANDGSIRQHIKELVHKEKSKCWKEQSEQLFNDYLTIYKDIWYYVQVFFCKICIKRYDIEIDFVKHLVNQEHIKKVAHFESKGKGFKFYQCSFCVEYWFDKTDSYEDHCKDECHKYLVANKDYVVPNLIHTATKYLDNINENADLLVEASDKANFEQDKEVALVQAIVDTITPAYPNAQAYIFGSRLSNLGFPDSDVDIFLDCESAYHTSLSKEQSQQCIKSIENYFESTPDKWIVDDCVIATRVPILKLRHTPTNLRCDISVTNGLSVEKSKLLGVYNRASPLCRKLILFMKKWLNLCRIFGSDYITTFAISWCVVFYLQLQGILPSVHELIKRKESKILDGWECGFEEKVTSGSSDLSFKKCLKGFFTYFANFDYQKSVICPYLGKIIDKRAFAYTNELPQEMDIYKKRSLMNEEGIFRFDSAMCIQDPVDLSQNMTKGLKKQYLRYFRQYCLVSAEKC